jgi:predicted nucleic acid-binding protein
MKDRFFIDTNVILYLMGTDADRIEKVEQLMQQQPVISSQVVNEVVNVCLRKFSLSVDKTFELANGLLDNCDVVPVDTAIIRSAMNVFVTHKVSHWDSLIIAAALQAGCNMLYTEDFQHNQIIKEQLRILNPFIF